MEGNGRFDHVRYDDKGATAQRDLNGAFIALVDLVENIGEPSRAASLAITKLEEAHMWAGKAIRDAQIARQGDSEDRPRRSAG